MLGVFSTKQRHDITVFNTCNGNNLYLWYLFKEYLKLLNKSCRDKMRKNKIINNMTQQLPTRIAMLKFAEQLPICHV
jgi:hypothetical protein